MSSSDSRNRVASPGISTDMPTQGRAAIARSACDLAILDEDYRTSAVRTSETISGTAPGIARIPLGRPITARRGPAASTFPAAAATSPPAATVIPAAPKHPAHSRRSTETTQTRGATTGTGAPSITSSTTTGTVPPTGN
jgi:hypothetical protein